MDKVTKAHIWETLAAIDITQHTTETEITDQGKRFPAVSWMNAHVLMMKHFPEYTWEFTEDPEGREVHYFNDGTCEVRCRMTVEGHTQITSLFVRNTTGPVRNPNSSDINTAKQRCRVKAMAEFGLGHELWLKTPEVEQAVEEVAQESPEPDPEPVVNDDKNRQAIDRVWIKAREEIEKARTKTAGQKIFDRFVKALATRGLEDYKQDRWLEVCEKKGWKA